jgi:hypothetical protein
MKNQSDRAFLEYLYHCILWRFVTQNEFAYWLFKAENGQAWDGVLREFTRSNLFNSRVQKIIDSAIGVRKPEMSGTLYHNI